MTDLLLAEDLFLLTHDDESGKQEGNPALNTGIGGAILLDLAAAELVVAKDDDKLLAVPGTAQHPLLAEAHAALLDKETEPRKADRLINRIARSLRPVGTKVGQSLAERGILAEEHGKALGLFPRTTWPERDPAPERALRADLHAVLVTGAEPTPRRAMLIALLSPLGLVRRVVDKEDRKAAERRAKDIAESNAAVSDGVARSIQAAQAAVFVAVMVPAIASGSN